MAPTAPRLYAALGFAALPLYFVFDAAAQWSYEVFLIAALVAIGDRVRREDSWRVRKLWLLWGAGLLSWLIGDFIGMALEASGGTPFPSLVDLFYLAGYPFLIWSQLYGIRLRSRQRDPVAAIDGLLVAVAVFVPVYVVWIEPATTAAGLSTFAHAVSLAYPLMDLVLLAVCVRLLLSDGHWSRGVIGFMVGIGVVLISDLVYNVQILAGTYTQPSLVDLGWLVAFVLWGASAVRPTGVPALKPGTRPVGVGHRGRSWVLGVIIALPLWVVARAFIDSTTLDARAVLLPLAVIAALIIARLRLVARHSRNGWQGAAILSAIALLVVAAAVGATRTNASGRTQAAAAARIDRLTAAVQEGDGLVAWTLTVDPDMIARMAPRLYEARSHILSAADALNMPEAPRLRAAEQAWLSHSERQLMLTGGKSDPAQIRQAILEVVPLRDTLLNELQATGRKYHQAAASSARRGRTVAMVVLGAALLALWILMLRFGAVSRRVELAEERSRAVRESEEKVRALLGASADILTVVDPETRVLAHADQVARVLSIPQDGSELRLDAFLDPDQAAATREALAGIAGRPGAQTRLEWSVRQPDGSTMHAEVSAVDHTEDPRIGGIVLSVRDVTERRRLEAALEHQALHDPLTGLANRVLLTDRLAQLLARSADTREAHALVMLDLDDFRAVNDSFGHRQGDQILQEIASRLEDRANPRDTLARVGGDGFAFLIENVSSEAEALERADLMIAAMQAPIALTDGAEHLLRGSIGIALCDGSAEGAPAEQASLMFRDAELAMYEAKRQEGNSAEIFAPHMHDAVTQRLALRSEMVVALERGEFLLHYQPIVELRTRRIVGYEALVRWMHPVRGMVSPGEFIPVAEQSGLIVDLGDWVLREATRQLAEWQPGWDDERYISVNVAGQQLERPDHLQRVREALECSGLAPRQLLLEMTESSLIHDTEASIQRLDALRGLGVRLAIDDFGTGYSSLNYLHRFAVDVLKVDKSFVDDVADGERGAALVDAIVTMARRLGLTVVAEGIEELEQVDALVTMQCVSGQGFHFSRPLPAADVVGFAMAQAMRRAA